MKIGGKRVKPRWEAIILALVALLVIVFVVVKVFGFIFSSFDSRNSLYCNSNSIKIVENLINEDMSMIETVGDYYAYGENLVLTSSTYDLIGKTNDYVNETFKLVDLCSSNEYSFTSSGDVDKFIKYGDVDLANGLYMIFHVKDGNDYPLKSSNIINDNFSTVTNGGTRKSLQLIADSSYFNQLGEEYVLSNNLVMLRVSDDPIESTVYDIIVDPSFNDLNDETYSNDVNFSSDESVLLYEMATELVAQLNSLGYKATITRQTASDPMLTYGENSRVGRTMVSGAKYYIGLALEAGSRESDTGASIVYSSYSSGDFANSVKLAMAESGIVFEGEGVMESSVTNNGYDQIIDVREIGGKALQAGTYSSYTVEQNGMFAGITQGVQGIKFNLGYFTNSDDMTNLETNSTAWAKSIAAGIDAYLSPVE